MEKRQTREVSSIAFEQRAAKNVQATHNPEKMHYFTDTIDSTKAMESH